MDNQYFWIMGRLKYEGVEAQHCPTRIMLVDFVPKPLQRTLFRKFRDVVDEKIVSIKELVEKWRLGENQKLCRKQIFQFTK